MEATAKQEQEKRPPTVYELAECREMIEEYAKELLGDTTELLEAHRTLQLAHVMLIMEADRKETQRRLDALEQDNRRLRTRLDEAGKLFTSLKKQIENGGQQ